MAVGIKVVKTDYSSIGWSEALKRISIEAVLAVVFTTICLLNLKAVDP